MTDTLEMIDVMLTETRGRHLILASDVVDGLLDLRAAVKDEQALLRLLVESA